jgi:hypothetical protein
VTMRTAVTHGSMLGRRPGVALCLALAMFCAGCAGARVRNLQADDSLSLPRPARVLVYDFNTGPTDVQVLPSVADDEDSPVALSQ